MRGELDPIAVTNWLSFGGFAGLSPLPLFGTRLAA
jgi:hypothetical protein